MAFKLGSLLKLPLNHVVSTLIAFVLVFPVGSVIVIWGAVKSTFEEYGYEVSSLFPTLSTSSNV